MVTLKKFSAVWCGPCRALAPVINEVKTQFSNVKFEEYDVDTHYDEATKYSIRSVPTIVVVENGRPVGKQSGVLTEGQLRGMLN